LAQVLYTGKDFVLIDFDGAGKSSLAERRRKRSALRDVARMVRSFRYAAHVGRARGVLVREQDQAALLPWESVWSAWAAAMFLRGYFERAARAPFLPDNPEVLAMLLDRYVLAHALHELEDWMDSPLMNDLDVPIGDILSMLGV
ncbi:MAG: hypothetical protein JOZ69_07140, partial [Myxococcales bacterium]|nr:hypothetical protein [Myxococcales bacterium]